MGSKIWIFTVVVSIFVFQWYPTKDHNLLVLVESSTFDISRLSQIKELKAVFKIDANIDEHMSKNNPEDLQSKVKYLFVQYGRCEFNLLPNN